MRPILRESRELDFENARRLAPLKRWLMPIALAAMFLYPFDFPIPFTTYSLSSLLWIIIATVVVISAVALSHGKRGSKGVIPAWAGGVMAVAGIIIFFAAVATLPPAGPSSVTPGAVQLGMQINPSVDTTAAYPAGSYTGCVAGSYLSAKGVSIATGIIWAAISSGTGAVFNQGPGNSGNFVMQTGAQGAAPGGAMKANCFQMKFVFTYLNVPTATGGGAVGLPIYVYMNSLTTTSSGLNINPLVLVYNNGTIVNTPVFPNNVGLSDFPVLLKDGAGNWQPLCQNLRGVNPATASISSCAGFDANLARTTGQITFTLDVITNFSGWFGWTTTSGSGDSPVGSVAVFTFSMGLPQSLTNPTIGNAYTPTLATYTLSVTRTTT